MTNSHCNFDVKLIHLLTIPSDEREIKSVENLSVLKDYGIDYIKRINLPETDYSDRPTFIQHPDKKPGRWGNYQAFRDAILYEFDSDFLMLCECDCVLEISHNEFVELVNKVCEAMRSQDLYYVSFGDSKDVKTGETVSNKIGQIPNVDFMYLTDKIICCHCIIFYKNAKKFLQESFKQEKWDVIDLYFNEIFKTQSYKMAILTDRVARQVNGMSLIDGQIKDLDEQNVRSNFSILEGNSIRIDFECFFDYPGQIFDCFVRESNTGLVIYKTHTIIMKNHRGWIQIGAKLHHVGGIIFEIFDKNKIIMHKNEIKYGKGYDIIIEGKKINVQGTESTGWFSFYEIFIQQIYKTDDVKVEPGDICLDLGSCFGFFCLYAIRCGAAKVYAIEPSSVNYYILKNNVNNFPQIQTYNLAVGNTSKNISMHICQGFDLGNTTNKDFYEKTSHTFEGEEQVKQINIMDFLNQENIQRIDLLKIDIEGSEYDVFQAMDDNFLREKVYKIIGEYHINEDNRLSSKIINKLEEQGFDCKVFPRNESEGLFSAVNKKFLRNRKNNYSENLHQHDDIIIVNTYIDSSYKEKVLVECLQSLKKIDKPIILTSHSSVPVYIQQMVDYFIFDRNNISQKCNQMWWYQSDAFYFEKKYRDNFSHALAALSSMFNGFVLAKNLEKRFAYHIEYDNIISYPDLLLLDNMKNRIINEKKDGYVEKYGEEGISMLFNVLDIDYFFEHFTTKRYKNIVKGKAYRSLAEIILFDFLKNENNLGNFISNIRYKDNITLFEHSQFNKCTSEQINNNNFIDFRAEVVCNKDNLIDLYLFVFTYGRVNLSIYQCLNGKRNKIFDIKKGNEIYFLVNVNGWDSVDISDDNGISVFRKEIKCVIPLLEGHIKFLRRDNGEKND